MAGGIARKKGKTNRKHGRNSAFCAQYMKSGRRARNKKAKIKKHLKAHSQDLCAIEALERL